VFDAGTQFHLAEKSLAAKLLEAIDHFPVGAIADGMDRNRNSRLVRLTDAAFHFPFGEHFLLQQPAIAGGVAVGFEEIRRAPSQRTVGESFQAAEPQPGIGGGADLESRQRLSGAVPVDEGQPGVNPARQFIAAAERAKQFPLAPGRVLPVRYVLHGSDAVTSRFPQSPAQGLGLLVGRGRGHDGLQQLDGGVLQYSGGFAGRRITVDFAADRIGSPGVDARQTEGDAVGEADMQVQAGHKRGNFAGDGVDPILAGERGSRPTFLVPAAAPDPAAFRRDPGSFGNSPDEFRRIGGAPQVDRQQKIPASEKMRVAVDKSGQHRLAFQVQDRRLRQGLRGQSAHFFRSSDGENAAVAYRQGLRGGVRGIKRADVGVDQDEIRLRWRFHGRAPPRRSGNSLVFPPGHCRRQEIVRPLWNNLWI